jgi:hypothetical protein
MSAAQDVLDNQTQQSTLAVLRRRQYVSSPLSDAAATKCSLPCLIPPQHLKLIRADSSRNCSTSAAMGVMDFSRPHALGQYVLTAFAV